MPGKKKVVGFVKKPAKQECIFLGHTGRCSYWKAWDDCRRNDKPCPYLEVSS